MVILSTVQAHPLLEAFRSGSEKVETSLDLNRTRVVVGLGEKGVKLPDGGILSWEQVEEIAGTHNACFAVQDGQMRKAQVYSAEFNRFYSLYPTRRAPTMLLSGIPMHRIKHVDPVEDTERKMKTIAPVTGEVLDVCTGLGYTAMAAARTGNRVTTIELDPMVLEVCRLNPWSHGLFDNAKIEQKIGDAAEIIESFPDGRFMRVFHDPPTFSIAGQLYSGAFYSQLYRVMKRGARLFHYIGDLESTSGRVVTKGVVKRLQEAGFSRVERTPEAFGVAASKG
jgi:predicted methyltransferase